MTNSIETAMYTLGGGIILHVFSRLIENQIIHPKNQYNSLKGKIKENLSYHANKFGQINAWKNNSREFLAAFDEIRLLAAKCYSFSCLYSTARFFKIIPSKKDLNEVGNLLIGLSNCTNSTINVNFIQESQEKIEQLLNL